MTHSTSILFVMSGGLHRMKVLGQIVMFAKRNMASLTLLDVIESLPRERRMLITSVSTGDLRNSIVQNRLAQLEDLASRFGSDLLEVRPRVRFGKLAQEITGETIEGSYDLVIKTQDEDGSDRHLLRTCNCPVWVLKPEDFDESGQILASNSPEFKMTDNKSNRKMCFKNPLTRLHRYPGNN